MKILKNSALRMILCLTAVLFLYGCGEKTLSVEFKPVGQKNNTLKSATLKVFMENSGSIDGYMFSGSELIDAVMDYVSFFEPEFKNIELYYINSKLIPQGGDLNKFIQTLNPASFKKAGGNRLNSDMREILENVMLSTSDHTVSMFVSDCILDVPQGQAPDFFVNAQINIRNIVRKYINGRNNSVEVLQLKSHFKGSYYGLDGTTKLDAERPYFVWIFGNNDLLAEMNQKMPAGSIKHGVKGEVVFCKKQAISFDVTNKNGLKPEKIRAVKGIYEIKVHVDLKSLMAGDAFLSNSANYVLSNKQIKITDISPIKGNGQFSHEISLSVPANVQNGVVKLSIINGNKMPGWVEASNDESGKKIEDNLDKTTGIKYLIGGVAEAYQDEDIFGEIEFKLINK